MMIDVDLLKPYLTAADNASEMARGYEVSLPVWATRTSSGAAPTNWRQASISTGLIARPMAPNSVKPWVSKVLPASIDQD